MELINYINRYNLKELEFEDLRELYEKKWKEYTKKDYVTIDYNDFINDLSNSDIIEEMKFKGDYLEHRRIELAYCKNKNGIDYFDYYELDIEDEDENIIDTKYFI